MTKRIIFILLTILSQIGIVSFVCNYPSSGELTIGSFIGSMLIVNLLAMLFLLVVSMSFMIFDVIDTPLDIISPIHGYATFGFKKIYYSELGYFWMFKFKNTISVYEQKSFYMIRIYEIHFDGDIEKLKKSIKYFIEQKYHVELASKRKLDNFYKDWDGCLDDASSRDLKLNNLGIKK